jgi:Cu2+-exporting ATPase
MFIETLLIGSAIFMGLKQKRQLKTLSTNVLVPRKTQLDNKTKRYFQLSTVAVGITGLTLITPILQPVSLALLAYLCLPIFKSTWIQWHKQKKIGHDMLVSLLFVIGFFSGQLFALAIALFFYHLGKKILAQTQNHSKAMLSDLFNQRIEKVWLLRDQVELEVPLETVREHDCVVVNTGDMIPIDGVVIEGMSLVDQQTLTGESQPVEKLPQHQVFAATQVISGRIVIRVEKTGTETTATKIAEMLNRTADYKVALLSKGETQANQIALPLIALSALTMPFLGLVAASGILNATFGNRLQLTAPLSVLNHLNLAMQKGIMVKDGRALETLSKVDTILFDKTGTLTAEQPIVSHIIVCANDYQAEQLLAQAAAAESKLAHPIAKAIVAKAHSQGLVLPTIDESDFQIGLGVSVTINNKIVRVGSLRFMQQNAIAIPTTIQQQMETAYTIGNSIIFVAAENELKGILEIEPAIRPEIKDMIVKLRQRGIKHLAIVSGDHEKPTKKLAEQLEMDDYFAEVMPEDKAKIVSRLQQQGHTVCFIGDGINDAIAIKQADVSISLEGATTIARDLAQIVFMDGRLKHLYQLFDIATSLEKNLQDTVKTLYTPVLINLGGTLFFGFGLMTTVIINNSSLLLALRKTKQHNLGKIDS